MRSIFVKTYVQVAMLFLLAFILLIVFLSGIIDKLDDKEFFQPLIVETDAMIKLIEGKDLENQLAIIKSYRMVLPLEVIDVVEELSSEWFSVSGYEGVIFENNTESLLLFARRIESSSQYLVVSELENDDDFLAYTALFVPIAFLFLFMGFGFYRLARRIEVPLKELTQGTVALADEKFKTRLKNYNDEPFATLCQKFNDMADRIESLIQDQRVLIGAVPHELKTPLAKVRFALDVSRNVDDLPALKLQIEKIDGYLTALETTVKDTLLLSRLQVSEVENYQRFDLPGLLETLVDDQLEADTLVCGVVIDSEFSNNCYGYKPLLRRALANLIENAKRYAQTRIRITVSQESDDQMNQLRVTVEDDGSGIALADRDKLFVAFSRIDESRSRETGGAGLGLALVDLIMRQHKGKVSYHGSELGGAAFTLSWPCLK